MRCQGGNILLIELCTNKKRRKRTISMLCKHSKTCIERNALSKRNVLTKMFYDFLFLCKHVYVVMRREVKRNKKKKLTANHA